MRKRKKKRKNLQRRSAMISITFVVGVLFVAMMASSASLERQLENYEGKNKTLDNQIEEENERTSEIQDLEEYTKTDEFVEEIARGRMGLVKENEIVFREEE